MSLVVTPSVKEEFAAATDSSDRVETPKGSDRVRLRLGSGDGV